MKRFVTFSGILAVLTASMVLVAAALQAGKVEAREDGADCQIVAAAADQGYGVSNTVSVKICR